ncbi:MAG: hypothetical protein HYR85_02545 [Planctomycetes bacterium]|nr:hypothetical protein [Planctomycetota bacterium]MBI3847678.1 hypothetical protein [Planctomycetota bacterium]
MDDSDDDRRRWVVVGAFAAGLVVSGVILFGILFSVSTPKRDVRANEEPGSMDLSGPGEHVVRTVAPPRNAREDAPRGEHSKPDGYSDEDWDWMRRALEAEKKRRREAEFADGDTGVDMLRKIIDRGADPEPLFESFEKFKKPLTTKAKAETVVRVTPENIDSVLASLRDGVLAGTTFELSAGEFHPHDYFRFKDAEFITIRGAGMDQTLVKAQSDIVFADGITNLTLSDLTVDSVGGECVIDSRSIGRMLLERLRAKSFDSGGGHSSAVGVYAATYLVCDRCEFLGGFGRSPLMGGAISLRDRGLVYLKDCLMPELREFLTATGPAVRGSIVVADGCRLPFNQSTGCYDDGASVRLHGCTFDGVARTDLAKGPTQDLGGNVVHAIVPEDLPTLLDVLRAAEASDLRVNAARVARSFDDDDASYVSITDVSDSGQRTAIWFLPPRGRLERRHVEQVSARGEGAALESPLPVKPADAMTTAMAAYRGGPQSIRLERNRSDDAVWVVAGGAGEVRIDAQTGALVK